MFVYLVETKKNHPTRKALYSLFIALCCVTLVMSSFGGTIAHAEKLTKRLKNADAAITDAVENVLLYDRDRIVPLSGIDVSVTKGIVTLKGNATNLLAKQRAQELTETVQGVRAVVNRIVVKPARRQEQWLVEQDIQTALFENIATSSSEINVSVKNGVATLNGKVQSYQEKELADKVAKSVQGINKVVNNINVYYQADRNDFDIKADVKERLRWDTLVEDGLIRVEVQNGTVELAGVVGSAAEKSRAYSDAWVIGVTDVDDNNLKVKAWDYDENRRHQKYIARTETEIRHAVKDALLYDPRVKGYEVGVYTDFNTVTLLGTVDNLAAKRAAGQDARSAVGVFLVRNRLKVRTPKSAT